MKAMHKAYKRGYYKGYKAGKQKVAAGLQDKFRKAYPKIEKAAKEMGTQIDQHVPYRDEALKWRGFNEAMEALARAHAQR